MAEPPVPAPDASAFEDPALEPLGGDKTLLASLDEMASIAAEAASDPADASETGSAAQNSGKLRSALAMQTIVARGFAAKEHAYEQEGADAVLYASVPPWITYKRIHGRRYRQVLSIRDPFDFDDDIFEHQRTGITCFGHPGARPLAHRTEAGAA